MAPRTSTRTSNRASATGIHKNIANIAASDLLDSDDEFPVDPSLADLDMTLVNSNGSDNKEEDVNKVQEASEDEEEDSEESEEEEGSEEEEEESEESEEEDATAAKEQPVTKKRRGPAKTSAEKPADDRKITYTISIFSAAEMKKSKSAKKPTKTAILTLHNSEPFDTLQAQILVRIAAALHPAQEDYNDYNIAFTVSRQVTDPVTLDSEETYTHLVNHALKINSTPCAKIVVEAKEEIKKIMRSRLMTSPETRRSTKAGRKRR
ncbi:hypothetical protein B0H13DRAFT_1850126 [Mycena leptocephala]|nr:hypothetical protein B0H13DRAFT_1850126 [Mycena leptocephala]